MTAGRIVYVAPFVTDEIEDRYDVDWYSPAGQNKMQSVIRSIQSVGRPVTVVAPVVPTGSGLSYEPRFRTQDPETGTDVVVPPTVNIFGLKYLNRVLVCVLTAVVLLQLHYRRDTTGTLFYNFRLITTVPAFVSQVILGRPAVIEYEDGLFTHDSTPTRLVARVLRQTIGHRLGGAICVTSRLVDDLPIENTAIVRGYPSAGFPDELPTPSCDADGIVVMFAGHFDEVRGIDTYLSIIPEIDDEDVEFWISGTGKEHEIARVRAGVDALDDDRVRFFGTLPWDDYRERLVCADVLVNFQDPNAEISEYTFPSKLLDFMAAGGYIVSTDMGDLRESFDDELLIAGTSERDLVDAVASTIERCRDGSDPHEPGQKWIETHCTDEEIGKSICEVFDGTE